MSGEIEATASGHLAADAVVKIVGSDSVTELRLAVGVRRKDKSTGEWADLRTDWIDVSVWGWAGQGAATLKKGQLVEVRGRLTPSAYITKAGEAAPSLSIASLHVAVLPVAPRAVDAKEPTPF